MGNNIYVLARTAEDGKLVYTAASKEEKKKKKKRRERERESQSNKWKATELCRIMTAQHVEFLE